LELTEHYFKTDTEWREWLHDNHATSKGVYLIFYKVAHENHSMRWEEAVKVALCYGWIDSTSKSLGDGKRKQYFTPRTNKSVWSAVNKKHVEVLISKDLMHESGLSTIEAAKLNGSWFSLDEVEKGIIPSDLQTEFDKNTTAYTNFKNFSPSYRKSYLYWLNQAKREDTRNRRIKDIITLCTKNIKSRI
jgi:uncharacterized protein YdeI (YjbR/CyaY-like superfamily)